MFLDTRLGNVPRWSLSEPKDWRMNVPDLVIKNAVFIGYPTSGKTDGTTWVGTAFFVLVQSPGTTDPDFPYLVTVKHTADKLGTRPWRIRINTKDRKSILVDGSPDIRWWTHPTEAASVDCAVTPFGIPDDMNADHSAVPIDLFATDEVIDENGIGEGDEVFTISLFTRLPGNQQSSPLVRIGNVAMMPKERLPVAKIGDYHGPIDAYLVETRSFAGTSGSPVFVRETIVMKDIQAENRATGKAKTTVAHMAGQLYLLGMSHGHWKIDPTDIDSYMFHSSNDDPKSVALGLSVIVPAKKILEVINQPELIEVRKRQLAAWRLAQYGTTTSE